MDHGGSLPAALAITQFTLPNGLHVVLHSDRRHPIVAIGVMYHVGSKDEQPHQRGFAHFFEHLLFEGSVHIGRGEYSRHVEAAGGLLNANTNGDRTYYYEVLPSNQLALGLWLESERMLHARVDQKGIDTQREVVKEERSQRYDNQPYGTILPEVLSRAYTVHPYRWPTIGFMEDLDAATEADFQAFYNNYYVPDNAVLVLSGDFDVAEARALVERYFGDIPSGTGVPRHGLVEPPLVAEVRDVVHDRIRLPAVVHAYRIPPLHDQGHAAADMLTRLLSEGNSSRLERRLKDRAQLAVHVGAITLPLEHPGIALVYAIANGGVEAERLEEAMDEELARLHTEAPSMAEVERIKAQMEAERHQRRSRMAGIANELAAAHTFFGDAAKVDFEMERCMALTPDDLVASARDHFKRDARVALHYLPRTSRT